MAVSKCTADGQHKKGLRGWLWKTPRLWRGTANTPSAFKEPSWYFEPPAFPSIPPSVVHGRDNGNEIRSRKAARNEREQRKGQHGGNKKYIYNNKGELGENARQWIPRVQWRMYDKGSERNRGLDIQWWRSGGGSLDFLCKKFARYLYMICRRWSGLITTNILFNG